MTQSFLYFAIDSVLKSGEQPAIIATANIILSPQNLLTNSPKKLKQWLRHFLHMPGCTCIKLFQLFFCSEVLAVRLIFVNCAMFPQFHKM